nr:translation initiation factor IF-2-like isoform X2 [Equus asinus]
MEGSLNNRTFGSRFPDRPFGSRMRVLRAPGVASSNLPAAALRFRVLLPDAAAAPVPGGLLSPAVSLPSPPRTRFQCPPRLGSGRVGMETLGTPAPNSGQGPRTGGRRAAGPKALEAGARPRGAVTGPASPPASKLSRGDARPGDRGWAGDSGGPERRGAAPLGEPLFIAPGARNSAEPSGRDDAGAAGG